MNRLVQWARDPIRVTRLHYIAVHVLLIAFVGHTIVDMYVNGNRFERFIASCVFASSAALAIWFAGLLVISFTDARIERKIRHDALSDQIRMMEFRRDSLLEFLRTHRDRNSMEAVCPGMRDMNRMIVELRRERGDYDRRGPAWLHSARKSIRRTGKRFVVRCSNVLGIGANDAVSGISRPDRGTSTVNGTTSDT